MARTNKKVWFLVPPRTSMTNIAGPWEVFGNANDVLDREAYELSAFGPDVPTTKTRYGLSLAGIRPLPAHINQRVDLVVVAGASPADPLPPDHVPLARWLQRHRSHIKSVASVCTGAFALAAAGILDGKQATTHWMYLDALRIRFPKVQVVDEGIYVQDGNVWTSAGLTAGVDLALALVEADHGHALAIQVAKRMVLFLRRSGHQAQFSSALRLQEREPPGLQDISTFVIEHIGESLPVERIAEQMSMSTRTLSRWCREHLDSSPAELVRRLRMAEARRLLEESAMPLKAVATKAGFGDQSTLWRAFINEMGVSPADYRQRFTAQSM